MKGSGKGGYGANSGLDRRVMHEARASMQNVFIICD